MPNNRPDGAVLLKDLPDHKLFALPDNRLGFKVENRFDRADNVEAYLVDDPGHLGIMSGDTVVFPLNFTASSMQQTVKPFGAKA